MRIVSSRAAFLMLKGTLHRFDKRFKTGTRSIELTRFIAEWSKK
jgi:hypothetical protein